MTQPLHFAARARARRASWPLAAMLSMTTAAAPAHDWPSPGVDRPPGGSQPGGPAPAAWPGWIWRGPSQGAPAMPAAQDCRRSPTTFEVPGPPSFEARPWALGPRPMPSSVAGRPAGDRALREAMKATKAIAAVPAPAGAPPANADGLHARPAPPPGAEEPVTAGVVDDNADFGEYQAFRARWPQVPRRDLAIAERVLVDVRDERGRAVPDARIEALLPGGGSVPLWARTDAGGRAWLLPQADLPSPRDGRLELRVSKGGVATTVAWRRGQHDALQVRLAAAVPARAQLDVVFAIDATGSMGDEIDKLKRSMREVADQIARLPSRPDLCFGLVAYRDRGDEFFVRGADLTHDLVAFQSQLARLRADGGGDYPEAMNEALHTAIHRLSWRGEGTARIVILLADAPPQLGYAGPQYDDDARGALARGIKIFGVGASGLDRQGELVMRQLAQATGGRFVFLTYAEGRRPDSGPGRETVHDVRNYSVETLDKLLVRLVSEELARWPDSSH